MPAVNDVGEPCAGEPHARFDGRGLETGGQHRTAPVPDPTCGGLVEGSSLLLGQVGSCDLDWAWVWPGCRVVSRAGWAGSWFLG